MTTLTIATGDYSNVSVAIQAAELLCVKQFPYDEITPHSLLADTHTHTRLPLMLLYSHRSKGEDLIVHTLGQNQLLHRVSKA